MAGKTVGGKNVAIGFVNRVQNQAIAHEAAIHKNVDAVAVGPLHVGARRETANGQRGAFFAGFEFGLGDGGAKWRRGRRDFDQLFHRLAAEELIDAVGEFFGRRTVDDFLRRRGQDELFIRIGKRVVRDERGDVAEFGRV